MQVSDSYGLNKVALVQIDRKSQIQETILRLNWQFLVIDLILENKKSTIMWWELNDSGLLIGVHCLKRQGL